ncbi:MAG TPA: homogentisate 1,2-dioxygenase domain-containing protein [Dermatophilaceae bacterium]|nr:homogentisate 1,2-dioxygenase domain-containing protein [Dermatophilaceae bacterium]
MAFYRSAGSIPPKRHTQHRTPEGKLYYEELIGEEGFSSDSSLLYHTYIPSAITESKVWELPDQTLTPNHPLLPLHLKLHDLFDDAAAAAADVVTGRRLLLGNADVRISYVRASQPSPYYKNAIGDELLYIEAGNATLETYLGNLDVHQGDYVVMPRAIIHRWVPTGSEPIRVYCVEANSHVAPPPNYLSKFGQFLEHSPFCERDFRHVGAPEQREGSDIEVHIKHRGPGASGIAGTIHVVPTHPFDVVGWDGCLYPFVFNIGDYEPITGRVHQPPPAHLVWVGFNFVICNFVPRKVDYHPLAIPVPYYHSNVDSDEVMFYCGGDYEARKGSGIDVGSISLHPLGHAHGPQPGAYENSIGAERFDELAVMVDTFRPLDLGEAALACNDPSYWRSWSRPAQ